MVRSWKGGCQRIDWKGQKTNILGREECISIGRACFQEAATC